MNMADPNPRNDPSKSSFVATEGKTFKYVNGDLVQMGDFQLKIKGEVYPTMSTSETDKEGHWLCNCTSEVSGNLITRTIVIPAGSFDTKQRFLDTLRRKFGGGTFNFSKGVSSDDLAEFCSFLKEDFRIHGKQEDNFYFTSHIGFQMDNYWVLSKQVHVHNCKLLPANDHKYFMTNEHIYSYGIEVNPELWHKAHLKEICSRFLDMSSSFGINQNAFKMAISFVLCRLLRSTTPEQNVGDEGNIGMLYSQQRNVGKSLTLRIIAKCQGVVSAQHPVLMSGGDQTVSGSSLKIMLESISRTSLIVLIDDPKLTDQMAEFLLQAQGGLVQGSSQKGTSAPKGSFLMTSNTKEVNRIKGRVIRINFEKDTNFTPALDRKLHTELWPFVNTHKGFLVAWIIAMREIWKGFQTEGSSTISSILRAMVPNKQERWYKGASIMLFTYAMFHRSAGVACDIGGLIREIAKQHVKEDTTPTPYIDRVQLAIQAKISENRANVLTWLNPSVSVNRNGSFTPAIGLKSIAVDGFTNITRQEVKENCEKMGMVKAFSQPIPFAASASTSLLDIIKRKSGTFKNAKGIKIPKDMLDPLIIRLVDNVCTWSDDDDTEEFRSFSSERTDEQMNLPEDDKLVLSRLLTTLDDKVKDWIDPADINIHENVTDERIRQALTPKTKSLFASFTPRRKGAFIKGYEAASGPLTNDSTDRPSTSRSIVQEPSENQDDQNTNQSTPRSSLDVNATRKRLFPTGTIGAMAKESRPPKEKRKSKGDGKGKGKEKSTEKRGKVGVDLCAECRREVSSKSTSGDWIQCDKCNMWYHVECTELNVMPGKHVSWFCTTCKDIDIDDD